MQGAQNWRQVFFELQQRRDVLHASKSSDMLKIPSATGFNQENVLQTLMFYILPTGKIVQGGAATPPRRMQIGSIRCRTAASCPAQHLRDGGTQRQIGRQRLRWSDTQPVSMAISDHYGQKLRCDSQLQAGAPPQAAAHLSRQRLIGHRRPVVLREPPAEL